MNDFNIQFEEILAGHSPKIISLVNTLRELVQSADPELAEEVKTGWGNITYSKNGVVCAVSPHKAHVNLHFYKGVQLDDPSGLLEGSGKELRHVKIRTLEDIRRDAIIQLVQAAVKIDVA
jgi:hypothetical protein